MARDEHQTEVEVRVVLDGFETFGKWILVGVWSGRQRGRGLGASIIVHPRILSIDGLRKVGGIVGKHLRAVVDKGVQGGSSRGLEGDVAICGVAPRRQFNRDFHRLVGVGA